MDSDAQRSDRAPDFVLTILARRYTWAAVVLALPAGLLAVASIGLPVLIMAAYAGAELLLLAVVVLATVLAFVLWRWVSKRRARREAEVRPEPPLHPRDLEGLLELGVFVIGELERGDKQGFEWYLHYFVGALDRLAPEVRAELLRRGLDVARLRARLYAPNDLPVTDRRALYHALQRFVTVARDPEGAEPYRSARDDDEEWRSPPESAGEAEIRQTLRSRLVGISSVVVLLWTALPWAYLRISGGDEFVLEDALVLAFLVTPVVLLVAAYVLQRAAEQAWAAAYRGQRAPRMVAATWLSWLPVLGWTSYIVLTSVEIGESELAWKVLTLGLLVIAPIVVLALLIRRGRRLDASASPEPGRG
jgi:hypothetical protein